MISPELLLDGYAHGIFPMAMEDGEIAWFSPDPRGVIPLETFHVPRGLRRVLSKSPFEVRIDADFKGTMQGCAARDETWINDEIIETYCHLHQLGYAHSVETWREGQLAGGLYGVVIGGAFFGESMFSAVTDASKVALHALVTRLNKRGFLLLDTQWITPHLAQFGAIEIPREKYLLELQHAISKRCTFLD
jgi:leucyl/phenylalanyl-tRNA---protein transferase